MSDHVDNLITGLFCPTCGYDMTGHKRAERVTCPECGNVHDTDELWTRAPRGDLDRMATRIHKSPSFRPAVAIVIFMLVVAVVIGFTPKHIEQAKFISVMSPLRNIQSTIFTWADENGGVLAPHPAEFIMNGWLPPDLFVDQQIEEGRQDRYFHSFALPSPFDGTPQQRSQLMAAIALEDPNATYYQLGDYSFARWPDGWALSQCVPPENLILAWSKVRVDATRSVAFADGHIEELNEDEWAVAWRRDAAARTRLGIPVISPEVVRKADD